MSTCDGKLKAAKRGFLRTLTESMRRRGPPSASDLHRCQLCYEDSVVPVEAEPLGPDLWEMRLRCGECGTYRDVVVSNAAARRYDRDLNRGTAEIATALQREEHERMRVEAQLFIAALDHDLIDAGDFAPE